MKLFYLTLILPTLTSVIQSNYNLDPEIQKILELDQVQSDKNQKVYTEFYKQLSEKQSPEFLWISCSDSRVSEGNIFNTQPGKFFVHRNIGNLIQKDDINMRSVVEYAIAELKVKHVIVTGHYKCGGVKAAMEDDVPHKDVKEWIKPLRKLFKKHKDELKEMDTNAAWDTLVRYSIDMSAKNLKELDVVKEAVEKKELKIHTWVYNITSGLLDILQGGKNIQNQKPIPPIFFFQ